MVALSFIAHASNVIGETVQRDRNKPQWKHLCVDSPGYVSRTDFLRVCIDLITSGALKNMSPQPL